MEYKFLELWFPDLYGRLMSLSVPRSWLDGKSDDNGPRKNFDGSSVPGFATIDDSDLWLRPEQNTLRALPCRDDTAAVFCSVEHPALGLYKDGDTRYCLRNLLHRRLTEMRKGFELQVLVKLEFFAFTDQPGSAEGNTKSCYLPTPSREKPFLDALLDHCEAMGIGYKHIQYDAAKRQFQIVFNALNPLEAADEVMRTRHVVRQVARGQGYTADFAPKPRQDEEGSGLHIALSLLTAEGKDAFSGSDQDGLSATGRSFLNGLRRHGRHMMPVTNQWVNSYKRLQPGFDAPLYLEASRGLKPTAIQIEPPLSNGEPIWIELSHPDAACNPYLALAGLIGAGLSNEDDANLAIYASQQELDEAHKQRELISLPGSLREALDEFENSSLALDICGDGLWQKLLEAKRCEWKSFAKTVTDWEISEYRPVL